MIDNVTSTTQSAAASSTAPAAPAGKVLCHTPFGDVLVDELSTTNLQAQFDRRSTGGATSDEVAANLVAIGAAQSASSNVAAASTPAQAATADTTTTATSEAAAATGTVVSSSATPAAIATPAAQPSGANTVPTAQSVFGDSPWVTDPTGSGDKGYTWEFNPIYFATAQTAQAVANLVGGTVVQMNAMLGNADGPYHQDEMNNMVQLPNGGLINPGLVADFYDHGYSQTQINQMIQQEVQGAIGV